MVPTPAGSHSPGHGGNSTRLGGAIASAFVFVLAGGGCGATCDRNPDDPPVEYRGGMMTEGGTYMSSDWTGPLLDFPPGRTYRLMHELGTVPTDIKIYLTFSVNGTADANVSPHAGNQGVMKEINDEFIDVRNDTCVSVEKAKGRG